MKLRVPGSLIEQLCTDLDDDGIVVVGDSAAQTVTDIRIDWGRNFTTSTS